MVIVMSHGGKRTGAGRKSTGVTETKVVRVDALLVPVVNEMKDIFKETGIVPCVTFNQDDLKESYEARLELFQEQHRKVITKLLANTDKLKAQTLQQTTFIPNDKEQEQRETIDRLQLEIDNVRVDYQVIINLNKQKDKEIAQLKAYGAPEVNKLKAQTSANNAIRDDLKAEVRKLKNKPPQCQAIKKDGKVCGKNAPNEVKENNRLIHLCNTHHKP